MRYDAGHRLVELKAGEALFEVARTSASWPFIVAVGTERITALGTSFVVRTSDHGTSVVLVEGKVAVISADNTAAHAQSRIVLAPGQRLTLTADKPVKLDRPSLEKVTAWRTGYVDLDDVTLLEAVDEMNRYSRTQISVDLPQSQSAAIAITGIFRAGDSRSFANAVAESYGLDVSVDGARIALRSSPEDRNRSGMK